MNNGHLISPGEAAFLNLHQLPACVNVEQTAALLGRRPEHVPILVEGGFLKPLGDPPKNGIKMFAACEILEKSKNIKWLDKANRYLTRRWKDRNAKCREKAGNDNNTVDSFTEPASAPSPAMLRTAPVGAARE